MQEKKKPFTTTASEIATLCQAVGFGDRKAIYRALVSTWIQGDAACFVFNVAVQSCDTVALQRDVCPLTAQRGSPCNKRKQHQNTRVNP